MSLVCFESGSVSVLLRLCPLPKFFRLSQFLRNGWGWELRAATPHIDTARPCRETDSHTHTHTHTRRARTHTHMTRHPSAAAALTLSCRAITLYIIKRRGCTDCEIHRSLGELVKILTLINCELQSPKTVAINHNF